MESSTMREKMKRNFKERNSSTSCLYFLGMIGAAIHFISAASGFWAGAFGFLKAVVWPVILVYQAFQFLAQ